MKMTLIYESPLITVVEIMNEGVLCASSGGGEVDDLVNGGPLS